MTTHRTKATSPTGPRIYLDAPRASTGTMLTNSFDTRYDSRQTPIRASFSTIPSSQSTRSNSIYEVQPVSKRSHVDSSYGGGTTTRTEYAVRPRRESVTSDSRRPLSAMAKNVSPTRERSEHADNARDMVIYKQPRDDTAPRLLQPVVARSQGSAHHQRHNSATRAETGRYFGVAAPRVERAERSYHNRGPYVEKIAESRPPPATPRYADEPAIEYTGPREQFDRDFPSKSRRESTARRERPSSATDNRFEQLPFRRDTAGPPPAASRQLSRIEKDDRRSGFESDPDRSRDSVRPQRLSKGPVVHQRDEGYSSNREEYDPRRASRPRLYDDDVAVAGSKSRYREDADRERDRPRRDYEREEERPSERDRDRDRERDRDRDRERERERERDRERDRDRDRDREKDREREKDVERRDRKSDRPREREYEREREKPRHKDYEVIEEEEQPRRPRRRNTYDEKESSPDHTNLKAVAGAAAVGGLAAAGIASRKSKDDDHSDSDGKRERRRRHRKSRDRRDDRNEEEGEGASKRRERRSNKENGDDSSGSDTPEEVTQRRRPASRTRQRRSTQDTYGSDAERPQLALPAPELDRRPSREPEPSPSRNEPLREPIPDRSKQESPTTNEGRTMSPGDGEDGRPRKVSIVEPLKDKKEELKPKGILKPPRAVPFPEDPNPTREGVAPLKQAGKEGVPPGARWTKISRILVNPEALEKYHERYEEREDYVIVLRVVSRDEIEKLAEKTKEIREEREREWQKQIDQRRSKRAARGDTRDTGSEGDYDDRPREQLAIEAPPSAPPVDLRQMAAQNNAQQQPPSQMQPAYAPQQQQYQQQYQQPYQHQSYPQQWPPQQQGYGPQQAPNQQWQNNGSAQNSAEAIAATAPGQPVPVQHQHPQSQSQPHQHQHQYQQEEQFDASNYSQNV